MKPQLIKKMKDGQLFTRTVSSPTVMKKDGHNKKEKEVSYHAQKSKLTFIRPDSEKGFVVDGVGRFKVGRITNLT